MDCACHSSKRGEKVTAVVEKQLNGLKFGRKAHLVDFY